MSRGNFDVIPGKGAYRVCKSGRRRERLYQRFADAEATALELVEANPDETFVITQEVARVRRHRS